MFADSHLTDSKLYRNFLDSDAVGVKERERFAVPACGVSGKPDVGNLGHCLKFTAGLDLRLNTSSESANRQIATRLEKNSVVTSEGGGHYERDKGEGV